MSGQQMPKRYWANSALICDRNKPLKIQPRRTVPQYNKYHIWGSHDVIFKSKKLRAFTLVVRDKERDKERTFTLGSLSYNVLKGRKGRREEGRVSKTESNITLYVQNPKDYTHILVLINRFSKVIGYKNHHS